MATEEAFAFSGSDPREIHGALKEIPLYNNLEFNTHSTSQEHALKESGAWREYEYRLGLQGKELSVTEDPFGHYLQMGPGRFYRAYMVPGDPMVAGLTMTPNEQGGYTVDSTYSIDQSGITASAFHQIITTGIFDEFGGYLRTRAHNLLIPKATIIKDNGLARAVMDFGLGNGDNFVIPMPGIAPLPKPGISEEEIEETRDKLAEHEITGVFEHDWAVENETGGTTEESLAEYYRRGQFVGSLATSMIGGLGQEKRMKRELSDDEGAEVRYVDLRIEGAARHVIALKALAKNSPKAAELILI